MRRFVPTFGVAVSLMLAPLTHASVHIFTVDLIATSPTTVQPGGSVSYNMVGVLSGDPGLGLALWGGDLRSSYSIPGGLPQCSPGPAMWTFVKPYGLTNPAGYGGTPSGYNQLLQIGGGQNTIGYVPVPGGPGYPIGPVIQDIANTPVVLATGVANLPQMLGTYEVDMANLFANVLVSFWFPDPERPPVYRVEPATCQIGMGTLAIAVVPEPATAGLLIFGTVLITASRYRTVRHRR